MKFGSNLMAGGPFVLEGGVNGPSFECGGPGDFLCPFDFPGIQGPVRFVAADETTIFSTPLPAALPLFIGGAGLLGFALRRRKPARTIADKRRP